MFSKEMSQEIRINAESMSHVDFCDWIRNISITVVDWDIYNSKGDTWDFCNDYTEHLISCMDVRALSELDNLSINEDDIVEIETYDFHGFPKEIKDTDKLLALLGLEEYLVKESVCD